MNRVKIRNKNELENFYRSIISKLQKEANKLGWGLGIHGSLRRDLDLIAIPWTDKHYTKDFLAYRLMKKAGFYTHDINEIKKQWHEKPKGRKAISLILVRGVDVCIKGKGIPKKKEIHMAYLDLSIMQ